MEIGIFISGLEGVGKTGFTNVGFMVNNNYREREIRLDVFGIRRVLAI